MSRTTCFLLLVMIILGGCELIDGTDESSSIREVYAVSHGCASTRSHIAPLAWFVTNDTLHVSLLFESHCCAEYAKEIAIDVRSIFIALDDTSESACRCMCHFEETFGFFIGDNHTIHLRASIKGFAEANYITLADTVLVLNI